MTSIIGIKMNYLLICGFIMLSCTVWLSQSDNCYECFGLRCSQNQLTTVNCSTSMCFLLSFDVTNTFRSCYRPGGFLVQKCNAHRFSYCRVCKGHLCNNWPVVDDTQISCRKCARGICSPEEKDNPITFRTCPRFLNPELPRCYTLVDRLTNEYSFGCANEMTLEERNLCDKDYFQSVCRYCDRSNCNTEFFRGADLTQLSCLISAKGQAEWCGPGNVDIPYHGCYIGNLQDPQEYKYGCVNKYSVFANSKSYEELFTEQRLERTVIVCFSDNCNKKFSKDLGEKNLC